MSKNLDNIIKNILLEYKPDPTGYDPSGGIGAARASSQLPVTGNLKSDNLELSRMFAASRSVQASSCVPSEYVGPIRELKDSKASTLLLKATLGIIGRESDFGGGDSVMSKTYWSYTVKSALKNVKSFFDDQTSLGPGQITPQTAKEYGISGDLNSVKTAVNAVYKILVSNYNLAISAGYSTNKPSSNMTTGTGNSALDIAIAGHNIGAGRIVKYCETSDPKLKQPCTSAGKQVVMNGKTLTVYNKPVLNYLPNFTTGKLTTHGYVQEVAKRIKSFSCVDNDWSGEFNVKADTQKLLSGTKSSWDGPTSGDLRYWKALYRRLGEAGIPVKLDPKANGKIENARYFYNGPWIIWKDTNQNKGYPISSGTGTINKSSVVGKITSYNGKYSGEVVNKTIVQLKGGNGDRYYLPAFLKSKPENLVYQNTRKK